MTMFKVGDFVKLIPGMSSTKYPELVTGVIVTDSKMLRRTAVFAYKGDPLNRLFKQKQFQHAIDPSEIVLESPWDTLDETERKQFLRNIAGYLFRDKSAYDKIKNLIS